MLDAANQDQEEKKIKEPERETPITEQKIEFDATILIPEKREVLSEVEMAVKDELKKEIDMMKLDDRLKGEAEKKAKKIEFLGEKEKIEHLLMLVRERGLMLAIEVAKKTNDPYILDIFHDILVKEGFYKTLQKQ